MKRPANAAPTTRPASTTAERHVELIMNAFDRGERRIKGSPTWDDVDDLMGAIFSATNPDSTDVECHGR